MCYTYMCVGSRYLVPSTMYDLLVVLSPTRGCGRWEHGMVTHYDKKYVIRSDVHSISHLYDYTLSSHILQMYTINHTYMIIIYYPIYYRCKILFDYYPYYIIQTSKVFRFLQNCLALFFIFFGVQVEKKRATRGQPVERELPQKAIRDPPTSKGKWKFQP